MDINKRKFFKIFDMAIESKDITKISITIDWLMGREIKTFGREKFNEMYEYYKNNSDDLMRLAPFYIDKVREIDFELS